MCVREPTRCMPWPMECWASLRRPMSPSRPANRSTWGRWTGRRHAMGARFGRSGSPIVPARSLPAARITRTTEPSWTYAELFPNDVNYTIGKSDYTKDWYFEQVPHNENPAAKVGLTTREQSGPRDSVDDYVRHGARQAAAARRTCGWDWPAPACGSSMSR